MKGLSNDSLNQIQILLVLSVLLCFLSMLGDFSVSETACHAHTMNSPSEIQTLNDSVNQIYFVLSVLLCLLSGLCLLLARQSRQGEPPTGLRHLLPRFQEAQGGSQAVGPYPQGFLS